jgi:dTDP-glucose pyrophosphorylase
MAASWVGQGFNQRVFLSFAMLEAAEFVATVEMRQGFRIACPEEIAFNQEFIDRDQLQKLSAALGKSDYAKYVQAIAGSASNIDRGGR